jgi:hypothetical protein
MIFPIAKLVAFAPWVCSRTDSSADSGIWPTELWVSFVRGCDPSVILLVWAAMSNIEGPKAIRTVVKTEMAKLRISTNKFPVVFITHTIKAPEFIASYFASCLEVPPRICGKQNGYEVMNIRFVNMRNAMVREVRCHDLHVPSMNSI